ncbi:MAG: hypothetical protein EAZ07_02465 [Cytophagales bacterium]|nr:MAG: hypothetical protein EAZ07_02465 [Cytophagales bacterium]
MRKIVILALITVIIGIIYFLRKSINPTGTYVAKHNIQTKDSLFIKSDGTYSRCIYQNHGEFLFKNTGKWTLKDHRIVFTEYFPNDDRKYREGYNFHSVLMTYSFPLEKSFGRVVFDYDQTTGKYRFYKLLW